MQKVQKVYFLITLHSFTLLLSALQQGTNNFWCSNTAHTMGHSQNANTTKKRTHCCDYEDYLSTISEFCGTEARQKFRSRFCWKGSDEFGAFIGMSSIGRSCRCDAGQDNLFVGHREKSEWIPSLCKKREWDAQLFCSLLGNRTISLISDSTVELPSATLMRMIRSGGGGCAHRIVNCRCDFLYISGRRRNMRALRPTKPSNLRLSQLGDRYWCCF